MYIKGANEQQIMVKEDFVLLDPAMTDGLRWTIYIIIIIVIILLLYLLWRNFSKGRRSTSRSRSRSRY